MKNIVITGASHGIGKASVYGFSKENYKIFACARRVDLIQNAENIIPIYLDITKKETINNLLQSIGDQKIDVLINSAGGNNRQIYSDILNNSIEDFDEVFRLNTSGTFEVIKNIVPLMNQNEYPLIITMSSVAGQLWKGGSLPYHIAKSSESKLLDFLSKYLSEKGIRSTDLIISTVNSFYDKNIEDNSMTPEDIFSVIKFIIESPEYLTIDKIHLRHIKSGGAIA